MAQDNGTLVLSPLDVSSSPVYACFPSGLIGESQSTSSHHDADRRRTSYMFLGTAWNNDLKNKTINAL